MFEFIKKIMFSEDFLPHAHCYLGNSALIKLHVVSDLLIFLSYYSIPLILLYFLSKRQDIPFRIVFYMFMAFILACGTTHLMEVWTLWHPAYWVSGCIKLITAILSVSTALILIPITPKALSLRSATELEKEIRQRKIAENALLKSQERQKLLIENVQDYAIFMLDAKGFVVSWNPGAERINGYSSQEIIGRHFSCFYTPEDLSADKPNQELQIAILKGRIEDEGWRKRKDGTLFWASTVITAIYDPHKELLGFAKVTRDLTERKHNEEALKKAHSELGVHVEERTLELTKANQDLKREISERQRFEEALKVKTEELERSNKDLQQFAYIASHDLQEPLYIISGFTDSIKEQNANVLDEESLFLLGRIQNASQRMSLLICDLLQFARVNVQKDSFEKVDLNLLIPEILADLDLRIKESSAHIDLQPLPELFASKLQMRQLFQNLIMNAIKYRRKDVPLEIVIKALPAGDSDFVEIWIKDNGIGFEPEYATKILEPFQRLHTRSEYEGSGLGLAICQKIILRHNGKIEATSVPNEGAVFAVTLPLFKK